ncbi:MAG TPA: phosphatidylserine decarboxylase [Acidiferrobacteraceae bacterium]|nr:phosphatidylserine decarboxylase [Acidiferrobacteraceae bacterium]
MAERRHPLLAREGWVHIFVAVLAAAVVHYYYGPYWAAPLWAITLFVVQFFRDPRRHIPSDPLGVVSPADGRVVFVGETHDPYLDRRAIKISVFMNVFNVHSNRAPIEGKVINRWYHRGRFFNATLDKASVENERNALWLQTDEKDDITCVQVAGLIARRILCYAQPGDRLGHGERYGFIRFGSRVDVYLPINTKIETKLGDKLKAGSDIIAHLVH